MKKILAFAVAGLLMTGFVGCKSNGTGGSNEAMDSLSLVFGDLFGGGMSQQIKMMDSTMDINEVLEGMKYMADADTSKAFMNGVQMGMQIAQFYQAIEMQTGMPVNKSLFMKHLVDGLKSNTPMDQAAMMELQNKIEPLMDKVIENSPKNIANKKAGEDYMNKLKNDKSYTFTKSGIAYKMTNPGEGKNFTDSDEVRVVYVGKHLDGTEFDNSQGQPAIFNVKQVVPGFAEMLQLMKPGSKATVVIPAELAYGVKGQQPKIGPSETLIFEMETLGVQDPNEKPAMPQRQMPVRPRGK